MLFTADSRIKDTQGEKKPTQEEIEAFYNDLLLPPTHSITVAVPLVVVRGNMLPSSLVFMCISKELSFTVIYAYFTSTYLILNTKAVSEDTQQALAISSSLLQNAVILNANNALWKQI